MHGLYYTFALFEVNRACDFKRRISGAFVILAAIVSLGGTVEPTAAQEHITNYKKKRLMVYAAPGQRLGRVSHKDLPDPKRSAIPIVDRQDPYVKIQLADGRFIWLVTRALQISGGARAMPRSFKSNNPCLTKQGIGLGSGSKC